MSVFPDCHALATRAVTIAVSRQMGFEPTVHQFSATEQELNLPSHTPYQISLNPSTKGRGHAEMVQYKSAA